MSTNYKYDVAISFAEEDRNAALALALALELKGFKHIYYYPDQQHEMAGRPLNEKLKEVYQHEARYTVVMLSRKYFKKDIAQFELDIICKRMENHPDIESVIPVLLKRGLDLSKHAKLSSLTHVTWDYNPKQVAEILVSRLGSAKVQSLSKETDSTIISKQKNKAKKARNQSNSLSIRINK